MSILGFWQRLSLGFDFTMVRHQAARRPERNTVETPKSSKKSGSIAKRKPAADPEIGSEEEEKKPEAKKRKTKAGKAADSMPLAARTPVASLKKAMYIGAHVSTAGGMSLLFNSYEDLPRDVY